MLLQEKLTPFREAQPERRYGGRVFRVGDKVTQLRNNYDKGEAGIFNGTVPNAFYTYKDNRINLNTTSDGANTLNTMLSVQ